MNTDFAKLLNKCFNRIDGQDEVTGRNVDGSEVASENEESLCNNSNPVRSEIKDIIEEKIKQKASDAASPVLEKVGPIMIGKSVELEEASDQEAPVKAKILFSLKDFFERSKELQNSEDKFSPGEDEDKEDPTDLDKNVESLYNDEKDQSQEDDVSDIISDSDSDAAKSVEDSLSDKESEIEDTKGDEPDQSSDLESDINLLEKLKQNLDDNLTGTPKNSSKDESLVVIDKMNKESLLDEKKGGVDEMSTGYNIDDVTQEAMKENEVTNAEKKASLFEGSNTDPINIADDDAASKDVGKQNTKKDQVKSMFKNISISIVGSSSKTIDLETLLKKPPTKTSPKQTTNVFHKPNISVKRKTAGSPDLVFGYTRSTKSSILLSSDEDSPSKKSIPTVTLDETSTIEDVIFDDKATIGSEFDNCTHGDPMDYMCVECTYSRWRCEWVTVNPVILTKVKIKMAEKVQVNPVDIIQAVNWEKVFKFAGVKEGAM